MDSAGFLWIPCGFRWRTGLTYLCLYCLGLQKQETKEEDTAEPHLPRGVTRREESDSRIPGFQWIPSSSSGGLALTTFFFTGVRVQRQENKGTTCITVETTLKPAVSKRELMTIGEAVTDNKPVDVCCILSPTACQGLSGESNKTRFGEKSAKQARKKV